MHIFLRTHKLVIERFFAHIGNVLFLCETTLFMKYFCIIKNLSLIIFVLSVFLMSTKQINAANFASGVANTVQIINQNIQNGDIVSATNKGYALSTTEYDQTMFGVIQTNPGLVFINNKIKDGTPVVSSGKVTVRVTTANGPIQTNDPITSSTIPGVGEKATKSGYVIGTALGPYTAANKKTVGTILVSLNPHFDAIGQGNNTNIFSALQSANTALLLSPLTSLRYLLAVIVTAFSFGFGFIYFGGLSRHSIDAFGRNPLAAKYIRQGLIFNVLIAICIIISGLGVSYLILVL